MNFDPGLILAPEVTLVWHFVSAEFQVSIPFLFPENQRHRTDRRGATLNVVTYGQQHNMTLFIQLVKDKVIVQEIIQKLHNLINIIEISHSEVHTYSFHCNSKQRMLV